MYLDNDILHCGDFIINPIYRTLEKGNEEIYLTAYEFDTLYLLAKRPGVAWKEVRANKGSAGMDGITFEMIEE